MDGGGGGGQRTCSQECTTIIAPIMVNGNVKR